MDIEWKFNNSIFYFASALSGCLYHCGRRYPLKRSPIWQSGDVIGCLINTPKRTFSFYHNGKRIAAVNGRSGIVKKEFYFSTEPYFAAASLSAHQHIDFNFGQSSAFQYTPKNFCLNKNRYLSNNDKTWPNRLVGPTLNGTSLDDGTYWYKEELAGNHVNSLFTDNGQLEVDDWIDKLLQFALVTHTSTQSIQNGSKEAFQNSDNVTLRIVQSTVERIGADVPDEVFPSLSYLLTYFLSLINPDKLPNPGKLVELLYPYTQLSTDWHCNKKGEEEDEDGVTAKHRNTCLTLAIFSELYAPEQKTALAMNEELVQYLKTTILHSKCKSQLCFAAICLQILTVTSLKSTLIPKICQNDKSIAEENCGSLTSINSSSSSIHCTVNHSEKKTNPQFYVTCSQVY